MAMNLPNRIAGNFRGVKNVVDSKTVIFGSKNFVTSFSAISHSSKCFCGENFHEGQLAHENYLLYIA